MKLIILGQPGSGKGTLAKLFVEEQGLKHISTGDLFRQKIQETTPEAIQIKTLINSGSFVPDEITNKIAKDAIMESPENFILDGYPRTIAQAQYLDQIVDLDAAIYLEVEPEILIKRITGRRICKICGAIYNIYTQPIPKVLDECDKCHTKLFQRKDDNVETAHHRIELYERETQPLIEYYEKKGILKRVRSEGTAEEIFEKL